MRSLILSLSHVEEHDLLLLPPRFSPLISSPPPSSSHAQVGCPGPIDPPGAKMSAHLPPDHVCYVHCNFCNTVLAVNVPVNSLFGIVTVRCGHCANLLAVNMGALLQTAPLQDLQKLQIHNIGSQGSCTDYGSSSKFGRTPMVTTMEIDQQPLTPVRPPEKRQRVPSAYNRFIKEEIQRIKATNPEISHREAFSTAAKNWAHFPHIHFGLTLDGNKQVKLDEAIAAQGGQSSQSFY